MERRAVSASSFYGVGCSLKARKLVKEAAKVKQQLVPYVLKDLLNGPNILWKVFRKQEDALNFSKFGRGGLMTFAFEPQDNASSRLFLSAHPEVFWHYDSQRPPSERCSYELITESVVCKLYADLEYDKRLNPTSDGSEMVDIYVRIICRYLESYWGLSVSRQHVLDLDSSTPDKFSRHLIFNLPSACFTDNYHVGRFMKTICQDICLSLAGGATGPLKLISASDLRKLFIVDSKKDEKLFCDLSVYSKNRHFRLFRSTKKGKSAHLVVDVNSSFPVQNELHAFLSSLVTYVQDDCSALEFTSPVNTTSKVITSNKPNTEPPQFGASPYPPVDRFINLLVHPGRVLQTFYFSSSQLIVYKIVGNRYCGNIQRQHKSNNVKYVVNLAKCEYYQKCYDYDCSSYRSPPKPLPSEIAFQIANNSSSTSDFLGTFGLSEEDASDFLDAVEFGCSELETIEQPSSTTSSTLQKFPSFGLSDEAFNGIEF